VEPQPPGSAAPPAPPGQAPSTSAGRRTRTSFAFNSLIAGAVVLILLLVFILENTASVKISFFGATGHLPLGVALLLAAVGGALLYGLVGAARIMQLRRRLKHTRR
jgi:uncharacterized integral membrane protein